MPVLPCRANLFLDHKEIYQFSLACQQNCRKNNSTQIISISLEIEQVDPLVVIDKIATQEQLTFYLENQSKVQALLLTCFKP